jgi:hypothetical protein
MTTCKYACDTHRGTRCDLTNRPCHHKRQCEIGDEEDRQLAEAQKEEGGSEE